MKKTILTAFAFLVTTFTFCQTNFEWQIKDSVKNTQAEIYSKTKLFIGTTWKSAKDVIQNDDKEGGVILVKGLSKPGVFTQLGATYSYTYSYDVTFKMKDNKYFFELKNVKCFSTTGSSFDNKLLIEPHDQENCPYSKNKFGLKCNQLMTDLKIELQSIADSYIKTMSSVSTENGDW